VFERRSESINVARTIASSAGSIAWLFGLVVPLLATVAAADDLIGRASIVDGDTMEIHGTRIRLSGIDAPESSQLCRDADSKLYRCGARAANELSAFIAERLVSCTPVDRDRYERIVAICRVDNVDLNDWLVRGGLALDWPRYSNNMPKRSTTPNSTSAACGRAATSSPGGFAPA